MKPRENPGSALPHVCTLIREALSAEIDNEPGPAVGAELEHHLEGCPECRDWLAAAHRITRHARLVAAEEIPDNTARLVSTIMAAEISRRRAHRIAAARIGLGVVALLQLLVMALSLVGSHHDHHAAAELAAFELALAVGFASAALAPRRARGLLPLAGAVALGLAVTAASGVVAGHTALVGEVPHLTAAFGWILLFTLAKLREAGAPDDPAAPGVRSHEVESGTAPPAVPSGSPSDDVGERDEPGAHPWGQVAGDAGQR